MLREKIEFVFKQNEATNPKVKSDIKAIKTVYYVFLVITMAFTMA